MTLMFKDYYMLAFIIGLTISIFFVMLLPEYHKMYKNCKNRSSELSQRIKKITKEIPSITTYSEEHETEKRFEYDHWMDTTDLVDIDSRILCSSLPLLIIFKVNFSDLETEQAYKEHVEQFSKEIPDDDPDGCIKSASMKLKFGLIENEMLHEECNDFLKLLQSVHWLIRFYRWLMNKDGRTIIIIEKVVSIKIEPII